MYKQEVSSITGSIIGVLRVSDSAHIPFDHTNTDYQQFKIQVDDGTPLEDPEGNLMTQEEINDFLATIP